MFQLVPLTLWKHSRILSQFRQTGQNVLPPCTKLQKWHSSLCAPYFYPTTKPKRVRYHAVSFFISIVAQILQVTNTVSLQGPEFRKWDVISYRENHWHLHSSISKHELDCPSQGVNIPHRYWIIIATRCRRFDHHNSRPRTMRGEHPVRLLSSSPAGPTGRPLPYSFSNLGFLSHKATKHHRYHHHALYDVLTQHMSNHLLCADPRVWPRPVSAAQDMVWAVAQYGSDPLPDCAPGIGVPIHAFHISNHEEFAFHLGEKNFVNNLCIVCIVPSYRTWEQLI